jgi:trehalose synthase
MLPTVPVPPRPLDEYREVAGAEAVERVRDIAAPLRGARVLQISSGAFGTGVAELLLTQVGLLMDLGIQATWQVIEGSDQFFAMTKFLHTGLQGADVPWDEAMARIYEERTRENARSMSGGPEQDVVVVHDAQPAALISMVDDASARDTAWVWRCHLDLSAPCPPVWQYLAPHVARYDAGVFTMEQFTPPGYDGRTFIVPPSIDPLSARNQWIDPDTIYEILHRFGVQWTHPMVTQVSPLDPWRDPLGVIDAYRLAREDVPDLQLVLIAPMGQDDPEGWHYLELTQRHRDGDPNIFLLSDVQRVGDLEVNAFQRDSQVVLQKSIREGFGLTVSEALWKGTPVVGGDVGGIRLQVEDGVTGYLVSSVEECAERLVELLRDEDLAERMADAGRRRVREQFLPMRELEDLCRVLTSVREGVDGMAGGMADGMATEPA